MSSPNYASFPDMFKDSHFLDHYMPCGLSFFAMAKNRLEEQFNPSGKTFTFSSYL